MLEGPVQVEVLAELGANEGVQGTRAGPASEEVHAFPAQGPGARSGEKEADPVLLDMVGLHRISQEQLPVLVAGAGLPSLPGLAGDAKTYAERLFAFRVINFVRRAMT